MTDECIICLEELEKNIVTLSCGHKYHLKCIREWSNIKKKSNRLCTICNVDNEIINIEKYEEEDEEKHEIYRKKPFINILCCTIL